VTYCPACRSEWADDVSQCPVCGLDLSGDEAGATEWVCLGSVADKVSADFVRETLATYEIPAVLFSRDGFFGTLGLTLNPFYGTKKSGFEISVPKEFAEDAVEVINMILGDNWRRYED
jgi:hypothetical protein